MGQADVALLMVPSDGNFTTAIQKGNHKAGEVQGQTRQHARLINLLGVKQLIIGCNKMDTDTAGPYAKSRYDEVGGEMKNMLLKVGWKKDMVATEVPVLPLSGWMGDNLNKKSENMTWWTGQDIKVNKKDLHIDTLYDCLDKMCSPPGRNETAPMRMPVSGIYKIKGVGDVLAGRVEQGIVKPNEEVVFMPTNTPADPCGGKVFTIEMHHTRHEQAKPGDNVGLNIKGLDKINMPRVGDVMIYKKDKTLDQCGQFNAQIQTLDIPGEIKLGYSPIGFVRCGRSACRATEFVFKVGKETGGKKMEAPHSLKSNEMAEVVFRPQQPMVVDSFKNCEGLSRIAFLDGNTAVMLGKVTQVVKKSDMPPEETGKKKSPQPWRGSQLCRCRCSFPNGNERVVSPLEVLGQLQVTRKPDSALRGHSRMASLWRRRRLRPVWLQMCVRNNSVVGVPGSGFCFEIVLKLLAD